MTQPLTQERLAKPYKFELLYGDASVIIMGANPALNGQRGSTKVAVIKGICSHGRPFRHVLGAELTEKISFVIENAMDDVEDID
jgi:hypothetical protein